MKIEEAIQQTKPFRSEYHKAAVNLLYSHGWLEEQMRDFFEEFKITRKQYNILRILKGASEPVSTSYIRSRLLDRMSDVSRIVDRLQEKKFVLKRGCAKDKRLIDVSLSESGFKLIAEIEKCDEKMDKILGRLDFKETEQLNHLLDKLRG